MLVSLLLASLPSYACPTIATGTPSQLSFDTAQVAIVRQGDRTTFSVSVNPFGDPQDFALVMPVPEVLAEDEVRTIDPHVFATLDGFTGPRRVDDAGCAPASRGGTVSEDSDSAGDSDDQADVDVEAEYLVGEYRVVILSAEESANLQLWLDTNGFHLPSGAGERLQEYIDAGSYFLAAQVADDAAVADGTPLSPLQIAYTSEVFAIPIRLATLNSPGEQDMVVYAVTEQRDGRTGIANYPEFGVTDQCIWDGSMGSFTAFYEHQFETAWRAVGDGAWTVEFTGGAWDCNPCTAVFPADEDLVELGYAGDLDGAWFTRLKLRYTPDQADEDLVLYHSGIREPEVMSYADDTELNRECIDVCGELPVEERPIEAEACACGSSGAGAAWLLVASGLGLVRRRSR